MSEIRFDPANRTLAMPLRAFDALTASGREIRADPAATPELRAAGLLGAGGGHPTLAPALAAIAHPTCTLTVTGWPAEGAVPTVRADGWVDPDTAVVATRERDERVLSWMLPSFVPVAVAGLVGLGPRPPRLASGRAGGAGRSARLWGWEVVVQWDPSEGSTGRSVLQVVDTVDGFLVEGHGAPPAGDPSRQQQASRLEPARPVSSADVWCRLIGLLPRSDDLAAPAS